MLTGIEWYLVCFLVGVVIGMLLNRRGHRY